MHIHPPSMLPTIASIEEGILIVQKSGTSTYITITDLVDLITASVVADTYLINAIETTLSSPTTLIEALLEAKADTGHLHDPGQVGLGNVEDIAPADLPISDAAIAALDTKADMIIDGLLPRWVLPQPAEW